MKSKAGFFFVAQVIHGWLILWVTILGGQGSSIYYLLVVLGRFSGKKKLKKAPDSTTMVGNTPTVILSKELSMNYIPRPWEKKVFFIDFKSAKVPEGD